MILLFIDLNIGEIQALVSAWLIVEIIKGVLNGCTDELLVAYIR